MKRTRANRLLSPCLTIAVCAASLAVDGPALAQGSQLESLFDRAERFFEEQGRAIERQLNEKPEPPAVPDRPVAEKKPSMKSPLPAQTPPQTQAGITVPLPDRNPLYEAEPAMVAPEPPTHPGDVVTEEWTAEDIAAAKVACDGLLKDVAISSEPLEPISDGICGAPAPIDLAGLGAGPKVQIRPAATVTCPMAAMLARWIRENVQPAAAAHLGEPVVRIRNVASYVCRNRYNAPGKRISEHANANALDIAAFETASGKVVTVLEAWEATLPVPAPSSPPAAGGDTSDGGSAALGVPSLMQPPPTPGANAAPGPSVTSGDIREMTRSGTQPALAPVPPPGEAAALADPEPAPQALFLRAIFDGACKLFGTVLGPEANEAHRDHFHLDMKHRRNGGYCE